MERQTIERRRNVPDVPRGLNNLKWYGPGLVWMVSAVGSGSVLFTPRVGARYGYEFVWMAIIFFFFMFIMIREVGRYTVVTGNTIFEGYRDISGSSNWSLYFILIPAIVAAVVTIAGIAGLTASALMIAMPWNYEAYASIVIIFCLALVISGNYQIFERVLSFLAGVLVVVIITSAVKVFSSGEEFINGLMPGIPENTDFGFVIPWVGFILAGASGIMWFSYWVSAREYGGALTEFDKIERMEPKDLQQDYASAGAQYTRLKGWLRTMSVTALIGVVGGGLILLSFLVLGTELLRPKELIPEGIDVAEDLTKLQTEVWGNIGKWFLIIGMVIALLGTVLSNQDGYGRMFADGILILAMPMLKEKNLIDSNIPDEAQSIATPVDKMGVSKQKRLKFLLLNKTKSKKVYSILLGGIFPLILFFIVKDPVEILSVAGTVAAVHTPVVVFLTLHLNRSRLPEPVRPGLFITISMWLSGIAYGAFAIFYFATIGNS